jgi:hypothetical protein
MKKKRFPRKLIITIYCHEKKIPPEKLIIITKKKIPIKFTILIYCYKKINK